MKFDFSPNELVVLKGTDLALASQGFDVPFKRLPPLPAVANESTRVILMELRNDIKSNPYISKWLSEVGYILLEV